MVDAKLKKNRLTNEAIVLAASRGSAMSTLTMTKPKAMVKVKDKSILEHISNAYEEHGINKITVVRGYKKEAVNLPNLKYITWIKIRKIIVSESSLFGLSRHNLINLM